MSTVATYASFTSNSQILRFPANLKFRVYYLEAPLSFLGERVGINFVDNLLSINGFHTGIGFQCTDVSTPFEFTFDEIVAQGFVISSLLPQIVNNDLVWRNQPEITLGSFIDKFYWERSTYICTVTADQLILIQEWILSIWIPSNPIYSLLSAINSTSEQDIFNPIFRPSICDTFCYSLIYFIQGVDGGNQVDPVFNLAPISLNVCIEYETVPNVSISAFVSSFPGSITPVDFESNKQDIVNFYIAFEALINEAVNLEAEIQLLIAELQTAPPAERAALIRQITNDIFTLLNVIDNIYADFAVAYYYGYGIGENNNKPQYWKIVNPQLFLTYINSNLKRSYPSISNIGERVIDNFSLTLNCNCNCREEIVQDSFIWWIILAIIIIIIIIILILILLLI